MKPSVYLYPRLLTDLNKQCSILPTCLRLHKTTSALSIATQNVVYNQPTQPGFYFGSDLNEIFPEKEIETTSDVVTLKTAMEYDSYKWPNGETTPVIIVRKSDTIPGQKHWIELEVTYRGCILKDHVDIMFTK